MPSPNVNGTDTIEQFRVKVNNHFNDGTEHGGGGSSLVLSNTQTGTAYTLVLGDASKAVEMNNAAANTVTVPPNSSVAFPIGTVIEIYQLGAGATTIVAGTGVTLRLPTGLTAQLRGQNATATIRKGNTDAWRLAGDLAE